MINYSCIWYSVFTCRSDSTQLPVTMAGDTCLGQIVRMEKTLSQADGSGMSKADLVCETYFFSYCWPGKYTAYTELFYFVIPKALHFITAAFWEYAHQLSKVKLGIHVASGKYLGWNTGVTITTLTILSHQDLPAEQWIY